MVQVSREGDDMANARESGIVRSSDNGTRAAGYVLGVASILTVVFMAIHPTGHSHDFEGFMADLKEGAVFNGFVHGTLMALGVPVMVGLWVFAEQLGLRRMLVRAGLVMYAIGQLAGIGAATVNGFVLPAIAARAVSEKPDAMDKLRSVVALCMDANATLARMDVVALSAAVFLWSLVLVRRTGPLRVVGVVGLIGGLLPPAALFAGKLPMTVHGFGAFVLVQTIWCLAVAWQMVRGSMEERQCDSAAERQ
jgi:hypothetical protein